MTMTKKERETLAAAEREIERLKAELEIALGQYEKSRVYFERDPMSRFRLYLPQHWPVRIGPVNVRLQEDGEVSVMADDVLFVIPQSSNALRIQTTERVMRHQKEVLRG